MGFYNKLQVEILELAEDGLTAKEITKKINEKYRPILADSMPLVYQFEIENLLAEYGEEMRYG